MPEDDVLRLLAPSMVWFGLYIVVVTIVEMVGGAW